MHQETDGLNNEGLPKQHTGQIRDAVPDSANSEMPPERFEKRLIRVRIVRFLELKLRAFVICFRAFRIRIGTGSP
jgi:hypothetical protein